MTMFIDANKYFLNILVKSYLIINFYINLSLVSKKMEKIRGVIRELLKYVFELGHSAKEAMDNINRAKGHGIVAKRTAYEWFSKYKNNQKEIADKKRAGRPREIARAAVDNTVEAQ